MKDAESVVIEVGQRLSRSRLWQWQRRYFGIESTAAWQKGTVPHYVTSNTFIADAYAKVVLGFLRDCLPEVDRTQPIYIVELGAGVGRFGFHFLKRFFERLASSPLAELRVRYVLTDLVAANVDYYLAHPQFKPMLNAGQLACATFDVDSDGELRLMPSGEVLAPGAVRNPMVVIANYVFDGVPVDAFRILDGQLHETLVTLRAPGPLPDDLDDSKLLGLATLEYEHRSITLPYYEDASWNQLLAHYQTSEPNCQLLFPCAALSCISRLRTLAGNRLLLLSGDKGFHRAEDLDRKDPGIALHGSFSVMVNYHAIAQWARSLDAQVLHSEHRHCSLSINAFIFGFARDALETRLAFTDNLASGGPDDLFMLKKALDYRFESLTPEQLLALLRLCRWDIKIALGCAPILKRHLAAANLSAALRTDLAAAIALVQDSYFPIGEEPDPAVALQELLSALSRPAPPAQPTLRSLGHRFAQLRVVPR